MDKAKVISLEKWIGRDIDLVPRHIVAIAIRGMERISNGKEVPSDKPTVWYVDILTEVAMLTFSIRCNSANEAQETRDEIEGYL